jgi:hypothetical protein
MRRDTSSSTEITHNSNHLQGVGAKSPTVAQAAEQVPKAALHATTAAGATGAAMVPNVKPAAA